MGWLHAVIDVPADVHDAQAGFWAGALGWPTGPTWPGNPELRSFEPPAGMPYIHLQDIDGPPRVHLAGHLGAIHPGHGEIHQQKIDFAVAVQDVQRGAAAARFDNAIAQVLQ